MRVVIYKQQITATTKTYMKISRNAIKQISTHLGSWGQITVERRFCGKLVTTSANEHAYVLHDI